MKKLSCFLTAFMLLFSGFCHGANIKWYTDYSQAQQVAKSQSKPMVLFFTGSDWCVWCKKLEKEALNTSDFKNMMADKAVFVMLDFPSNKQYPDSYNKLKSDYGVRGFPTLILLDHNNNKIGQTGYKAGGGKLYGEHLMKMIQEHSAYRDQVNRLGSHNFTGKELKRLYQRASEFEDLKTLAALIELGTHSDQKCFFLTERYKNTLNNGAGVTSPDAVALKEQLYSLDPDNFQFVPYQLALIDYEALLNDEFINPDYVVSPLVNYILKFDDKEHLWRINMIISQVYLEGNRLDQALKYAKDAYSAAPLSIQKDISLTIQSIESQIQ